MLLYKKFTTLFAVVILVTSTIAYFATFSALEKILSAVTEQQQTAIIRNVVSDLVVFDELLQKIESEWDHELSINLPQIANKLTPHYLSNKQISSTILSELKREYAVSDIHIIDADLKVIASTFEPEIGLDMSKFSQEYTQYLLSLFNKGEYSAHRLSLSDVEGKLKKYAYFSLENSDLLINVDIDVRERLQGANNTDLAHYVFGKYIGKLKEKYDLVEYIDLMLLSDSNYWSFFSAGKQLDKDTVEAIYASVEDIEAQPEDNNQNGFERFITIDLNRYGELGFTPVLQIKFNNDKYDALKEKLYSILLVINLFAIILSAFLLQFGAKRIFLGRFTSLMQQINQKTIGDGAKITVKGNDELALIAQTVDDSMRRIEKQHAVNKQLQVQSNTDSLTQIPNRRFFQSQFKSELKNAQRVKQAISVILLDIDFFKQFNDTYGHLAGDDTLVAVAKSIHSNLARPRDFAARYGGEEFICVLPDTDLEGALLVANKMCQDIEALKIAHCKSSASAFVTVSVGCATMENCVVKNGDKLIDFVDTLLYQAKTAGKNTVVGSNFHND